MQATHTLILGYFFWFFGFIGLHRFYYNSKKMGFLYLLTGGLLGLGWICDLFYLPRLQKNFLKTPPPQGEANYTIAWLLLFFTGVLGLHRLYLQKTGSFVLYFFTFGLFGFGIIYDFVTINDQVAFFNLKVKK